VTSGAMACMHAMTWMQMSVERQMPTQAS